MPTQDDGEQSEGCLLKARVLNEDADCHMETNVVGVWINFDLYWQLEK